MLAASFLGSGNADDGDGNSGVDVSICPASLSSSLISSRIILAINYYIKYTICDVYVGVNMDMFVCLCANE